MDKLLFETATLADALQRATRVAPTKGASFDRAQGIVITADPMKPQTVTIMATNLTVSIHMEVGCLDIVATAPFQWRLPAALTTGLVSALPMGAGSVVTLACDDTWVYVICGSTKAKVLPLVLDTFPLITPFPVEGTEVVPNLAARLSQVAWAVDDETDGALSGVHLDGEYLYGCDKYCLAVVPCATPVAVPVTAPLGEFAALIRNATDVRLRATEGRIELMPDAYTQMTATIHADPYPDVRPMLDRPPSPYQCEILTTQLIAALDRMMVLVRGERMPRLRCHFTPGSLGLEMEVEDVGKMIDQIEVNGGETLDVDFTPSYLQQALAASGRERMFFHYGPHPRDIIRLTDDNGYVAMIVPRITTTTAV